MPPTAAYLQLTRSEVEARAEKLHRLLGKPCRVCPRQCAVDRRQGELGFCRTGDRAPVASYGPHYGEEQPLVGERGSGTIFFSSCVLRCLYCQNHDISLDGTGAPAVEPETLARIMIRLQELGCHNINLVSPTHVTPMIVSAVAVAVDRGLDRPLVYNSGGYDSVEVLQLLDGIIDIYMPDMKYSDGKTAARLSRAADYFEVNQAAVKEMQRQVGDLELDQRGLARRGLLVRHLVLPGGLAGTETVMRFLAEKVSRATWVNIMAQYRPEYRAASYPPLDRRITPAEYRQAMAAAKEAGLRRLAGR